MEVRSLFSDQTMAIPPVLLMNMAVAGRTLPSTNVRHLPIYKTPTNHILRQLMEPPTIDRIVMDSLTQSCLKAMPCSLLDTKFELV